MLESNLVAECSQFIHVSDRTSEYGDGSKAILTIFFGNNNLSTSYLRVPRVPGF